MVVVVDDTGRKLLSFCSVSPFFWLSAERKKRRRRRTGEREERGGPEFCTEALEKICSHEGQGFFFFYPPPPTAAKGKKNFLRVWI